MLYINSEQHGNVRDISVGSHWDGVMDMNRPGESNWPQSLLMLP